MRNFCFWYPWYAIFMSGIHDTHYLCLVFLIYIVYVWYPWYIIFMPGPCLWFYVLWIPSHQISLYLISGEVETMAYLSQLRYEICVHDPPMSCHMTWLRSMPNLVAIGKKMWSLCGNTQTHTHTHTHLHQLNYIYRHILSKINQQTSIA